MEIIECKHCGEAKQEDAFSPDSWMGWCRRCSSDYAMQWAKENPERYALNQRRYRMKKRYGMTLEEFDAMAASQSDLCAICKKPPKGTLCVDHNHETGAVRGLLCKSCNTGLGMLREDTALMYKAIDYLNPRSDGQYAVAV